MFDDLAKLFRSDEFLSLISSSVGIITAVAALLTFTQFFKTSKKKNREFLNSEYFAILKNTEELKDEMRGIVEENGSELIKVEDREKLLTELKAIVETNKETAIEEIVEKTITAHLNLKFLNKSPGSQGPKDFSEIYHAQGLFQSKLSFNFSIGAAVVGFGVILLGILNGTNYSAIASGIVIDAVAALFFVQSNKSRALMTQFFDKLRADKKFDESMRLADDIPDQELKSRLKAFLSINFAGLNVSDSNLNSILNKSPEQKQ